MLGEWPSGSLSRRHKEERRLPYSPVWIMGGIWVYTGYIPGALGPLVPGV